MKNVLFSSIIASVLLSSCSFLPNNAFNSAQTRWRNANVSHYRYAVHVGCFCAFTERMPLTVEVNNGTVTSMAYKDGTPVASDQLPTFAQYSTIDALFALTSEALRTADEVKVQYDPSYGFPSTVQIDRIRNAADDELSLSVSNFERLP